MEEDECDYRTPIGKVIKQINCLCKKPLLDNQLSEAIDSFHEKLNKQEKYLANGIFKVNFAESALFLQCCTELYGKKVDLLWKELLEVHTRLIKYDYEHQKENGNPINKEDIDRLEERRNRYLRKKKFKLLQEDQQQVPPPECVPKINENEYLIDEDARLTETEELFLFNQTENISVEIWNQIEHETKERLKIPYIVYRQMTRTYRLKNYPILKFEDFEILDIEDTEFNTRYSRVPGWNHILHLLEYNEQGLLPDNKNMLAKLKLMVHGKLKFLLSRKLPFDTPFAEYEAEYAEYCKQFFKEEAKKWQNMPLNTFEDFYKQLEFLADMHYRDNEIDRLTIKNTNQNDKIVIVDNSDEDSLYELTFTCEKDFKPSDLFIRLEKLSCDLLNTKLRQDSGIFEYNCVKENGSTQICGNEISTCDTNDTEISKEEGITNSEIRNNGSDVNNVNIEEISSSDANNMDISKEEGTCNSEVTNNASDVNNVNANEIASSDPSNTVISGEDGVTNSENSCDININVDEVHTSDTKNTDSGKDDGTTNPMNNNNSSDINNINVDVNSNFTQGVDTTENGNNDDDFDTRSFISDHDYCLSPPAVNASDSCNREPVKDTAVLERTIEELFKKPLASKISFPKLVNKNEQPMKKRHIIRETNKDSPPKRRKLSQKVIDALSESIISPVKLLKFEKFFSENYQSEDGEGIVPNVDYTSDDPDTDVLNLNTICDIDNHDDDTRSIYSDHSYCQFLPEDPRNDSGIFESLRSASDTEQTEEENPSNNGAEIPSEQRHDEQPAIEERHDEQPAIEERRDEAPTLQPLPSDSQTQSETLAMESLPVVPIQEDIREIQRRELRARVEEWRNTINPILRNLKEHDFDIHEYGSRIIEGMEIDESRPFSNIVQGKTSAEVVRYFISSLQLANTSNIDICGVKPGQLSNDTFNVKLLSRDRFHEHLQEYLAPSEETLAEKLEKVRTASAQQEQLTAPKAKQLQRTDKTYKGKKSPCDKKVEVKLCKILSSPGVLQQGHFGYQHNKENCSTLLPSTPNKTAKGKSIVKRQVSPQHVLNFDMSLPSTSRYTHVAPFDPQMPSTSSQNNSSPCDSDLFDLDQRHCRVSPNKRRHSGSSEETFLERLASAQRINPDIQVHSTPNGPPTPKYMRVSSGSKKSILF